MKLKTIINTLISCVFVISGCLPNYYPGIRGAHLPPLLSSNSNNGDVTRFISADGGIAGDFNSDEKNTISRLRMTWAVNQKHRDTNFGMSLYRGIYSIENFGTYSGDYEYFGVCPEIYNALYITEGKFDLGAGAYIAMALEGGDFLKFRRVSDKEGDAENDTNSIMLEFSIFPLIRYNISDVSHVSFQCGSGTPGGFSPTLLFQQKSLFIWGYWIPVEKDRSGENINFSVGVGTKL